MVGVKMDGTVISTNNITGSKFDHGQCEVSNWKLFNNGYEIKQDRLSVLNEEKGRLHTELANLKGLFTGKRRKEIEARLAEIDAELKKLG